jgi:hypothetical protein
MSNTRAADDDDGLRRREDCDSAGVGGAGW